MEAFTPTRTLSDHSLTPPEPEKVGWFSETSGAIPKLHVLRELEGTRESVHPR